MQGLSCLQSRDRRGQGSSHLWPRGSARGSSWQAQSILTDATSSKSPSCSQKTSWTKARSHKQGINRAAFRQCELAARLGHNTYAVWAQQQPRHRRVFRASHARTAASGFLVSLAADAGLICHHVPSALLRTAFINFVSAQGSLVSRPCHAIEKRFQSVIVNCRMCPQPATVSSRLPHWKQDFAGFALFVRLVDIHARALGLIPAQHVVCCPLSRLCLQCIW